MTLLPASPTQPYRYLYDGVEEADSEHDLPPGAPQDVLLEVASGDLVEGPPHVGPQAFGRLVGHLATAAQRTSIGDEKRSKVVEVKQRTTTTPGRQPMWSNYHCTSETHRFMFRF